MTDYTPTTEEVRDGWAYDNQEVDYDGNPVITLDEASAQFDRWLSDLKREIAAGALRDAAEGMTCMHTGSCRVGPGDTCVREFDYFVLVAWLRDRADRIEQGGES